MSIESSLLRSSPLRIRRSECCLVSNSSCTRCGPAYRSCSTLLVGRTFAQQALCLGVSLNYCRSKIATFCQMLAKRQLGSAASSRKLLVRTNLAAVVASCFLNADGQGLHFEASGRDISQSKNLLADMGLQSVD